MKPNGQLSKGPPASSCMTLRDESDVLADMIRLSLCRNVLNWDLDSQRMYGKNCEARAARTRSSRIRGAAPTMPAHISTVRSAVMNRVLEIGLGGVVAGPDHSWIAA